MGAWGPGTFEDDLAVDWLEDLFESDPEAFFAACLDLSGLDDLPYLACIGVLCTAEMIHSLVREPRDDLPGAARRWTRDHRNLNVDRFVASALIGLDRVADERSEMHERWLDHAEQYGQWRSRIDDLIKRLEAVLTELSPR